MKTPNIEFNESSDDLITCASPWASPVKSSYHDLLLKPEYANRSFKFPLGSTWFRIVPVMPSSKSSMLAISAVQYTGGRYLHPRTLVPREKSVFDHAYAWFKEHRKEELYSKSNKEGFRFLPDPICLFWIITEIEGKSVSRLLLASGYDGSRGGTPGFGYQIWRLTQEKDEEGNPIGNPADPKTGAQICIEKKQVPDSRYCSYTVKRGRIPVPFTELRAKMDPEEVEVLAPLEEVVYQPTEEEEWKLLENVIDAETIREIRSSVG